MRRQFLIKQPVQINKHFQATELRFIWIHILQCKNHYSCTWLSTQLVHSTFIWISTSLIKWIKIGIDVLPSNGCLEMYINVYTIRIHYFNSWNVLRCSGVLKHIDNELKVLFVTFMILVVSKYSYIYNINIGVYKRNYSVIICNYLQVLLMFDRGRAFYFRSHSISLRSSCTVRNQLLPGSITFYSVFPDLGFCILWVYRHLALCMCVKFQLMPYL
jgi:hypothetical protein